MGDGWMCEWMMGGWTDGWTNSWQDHLLGWRDTCLYLGNMRTASFGSEALCQTTIPRMVAVLWRSVESGPLLAEDTSVPTAASSLPITPPGETWASPALQPPQCPSATWESTQGKFQNRHSLYSKGMWSLCGLGSVSTPWTVTGWQRPPSSGHSPLYSSANMIRRAGCAKSNSWPNGRSRSWALFN